MLRTGFCLTLRHIASRNGIPTSSITACSDLRPVIATANTEVLAGPAISTFLRQYSSSETASRKKPNSSRNAAWNNPKIDPKAGSPKTLLQSWLSLDPKVRIKFGLAVAGEKEKL